jgi:hypothetical protein
MVKNIIQEQYVLVLLMGLLEYNYQNDLINLDIKKLKMKKLINK